MIKKISSWSGTVYLKSFNDKNGPWHIRLEVQLRDNALIKKIEGKALSCDPAVMLARLKKLRIFNFWRLESFNWEEFINAAQDSYATDKSQSPSIGKRISAKMLINDAGVLQLDSKWKQSLKRNHYAYSIRCKKTAHAIARRLGDIQLQTQINKGKFKKILA